jgi:hypothetical protein
MCKITRFEYTCHHPIKHVWSACRGQKKVTRDSNISACMKYASMYVNIPTKCGSCIRTEAEESIRRELNITDDLVAATDEVFQQRLAEICRRIPTTNWRTLASPVYSRKPSQKRLETPRRHSLLSREVKPEDACGPDIWEGNVVSPAYEAMADGWDFEWTSDTESLADELAEDRTERDEDERDDVDGDADFDDWAESGQTQASEADDDHVEVEEAEAIDAEDAAAAVIEVEGMELLTANGTGVMEAKGADVEVECTDVALAEQHITTSPGASGTPSLTISTCHTTSTRSARPPVISAIDSGVHYWFQLQENGAPGGKPKTQKWELVTVTSKTQV